FRTKLESTKREVKIFNGINAPDILSTNVLYQNLITRGVLNSTHQTWINNIYSRYADPNKYPLLANEIIELYSNLFYVLDAYDKKKSTFETSLGTIRVFFRITIKVILDTLLNRKEKNINVHLKGHTSHIEKGSGQAFRDAFSRLSLIEELKEKQYLSNSFSDKDLLNLSKLNNFMDSAAHRGDITDYPVENEARTKFKQMESFQQLEILLSVFKFLFCLELDHESLLKIEKNLRKYYVFNN